MAMRARWRSKSRSGFRFTWLGVDSQRPLDHLQCGPRSLLVFKLSCVQSSPSQCFPGMLQQEGCWDRLPTTVFHSIHNRLSPQMAPALLSLRELPGLY